jgi:hypothetical protein
MTRSTTELPQPIPDASAKYDQTGFDASLIWTLFAAHAMTWLMTDKAPQKPHGKPAKHAAPREDRLKAALKANMGRRKAQARARASGEDNKAE